MVQMVAIHKPSGLLTVHRLLELAAEEGIADIELMHRPTVGRGKGEHNAYGHRLDNRRERLIEINARTLGITAQHPACLSSLEQTVRVELVF